MESPEEFTGSNDHTLIIKGKRTKRQRPSSPFGAAVTSSLSSGDGGGGHGGGYWSIPSPASSGEISTSTEEDEDMANCLILLAQGGFGSKQVEEAVAVAEEDFKIEKLSSSRRFAEMATTTAGKAGLYVYECKTCNRTFPSFQALGGHRASHKKPKTTVEEKISPLPMTAPPPDDDDDDEEEGQFAKISPPLSLPMATKPSQSHTNQKSKVHECSICGSEFSSGQALGGHMRRHRAAPNTRTATNIIDTSTVIMESHEKEENDNKPRKFLALDLNLPAPVEDDHHHHHHQVHRHRDTKFQFTTPNKQHLVFSAAALVDCHY